MSLKYHSDTNKHFVSSQFIVNTCSHDTVLLGKDGQAEVKSRFLLLTAARSKDFPVPALVKVVGLIGQNCFWGLLHCSSVSTKIL